jgi:DnaK suppressor protein
MSENTEKTRYSDDELQEFKELILKKLEESKRDYERIKSNLMTDDSTPTFKVLEEGAATLSKEEASQRAQRLIEYMKKLQAALVRIENKTYGVCRVTGKLIPKERLRAVPHATLSLEGKELEQQSKK